MPAVANPAKGRPRPSSVPRPPRRSPDAFRTAPRGPSRDSSRPTPAREHEILFQKFFKSVGPRTYAAQIKKATNGNHYLVLTEGKRDHKTNELRKCRLFIYSEDFVEFFRMIKSAAEFIKDHPLPADVRRKRDEFWKKRRGTAAGAPAGVVVSRPNGPTPAASVAAVPG